MTLDTTQLQVLIKSGSPQQQVWAAKVLPLRKNGHLLLITLLISNMIVSLPFLDPQSGQRQAAAVREGIDIDKSIGNSSMRPFPSSQNRFLVEEFKQSSHRRP
jgi:hypothetical protein